MKKILVLFLGTLLSLNAFSKSDDCEENVDMADSLDFQKMHVDCADDPISLYDPQSKNTFLSKKKKTVTAYEKSSERSSESVKVTDSVARSSGSVEVIGTQEVISKEVAELDNAGVIFNIREPFTITGGPQSAINGLFVQMVQYCDRGWTKHKEWVEPSESGFYLHYQFQCAE